MTACYLGRTPLSPWLKVILLHGSKLINLSNLCLSRWHYPDSYIYCAFAVIPCDLRDVIHIPQGTEEDLPFHQLFFFLQTNSIFLPSSVLATLTSKPKFSEDCTPFKWSFTTKLHGTNLGAKITIKILHFLCSPSYSRSRTTPWTRQTFCLIQHSWSHILCTQ